MGMVLAGIDEAGYGPTLGPLCVGLAVLRVKDSCERAPDLWATLERGVCREPARGGGHDKRGRIAVADSKSLKLSNSVKSTHPLVHLERGVLTFASCLQAVSEFPGSDAALFELLGARLGDHACYASPGRALPLATTAGELAIARRLLRSVLDAAGVEVLHLGCEVVNEELFNSTIRELGNKAETTALAVGGHLRRVWERWGHEGEDRLGVVCDRLGGRAAYAGLLEREIEGAEVATVEESDVRSRYVVKGVGADGVARRAGVAFLVEGEAAHLPVALASMIAKFVRELAMLRFNAYWGGVFKGIQGAELKPTAGYALDARRWLDEVGNAMGPEDRGRLVRVS